MSKQSTLDYKVRKNRPVRTYKRVKDEVSFSAVPLKPSAKLLTQQPPSHESKESQKRHTRRFPCDVTDENMKRAGRYFNKRPCLENESSEFCCHIMIHICILHIIKIIYLYINMYMLVIV